MQLYMIEVGVHMDAEEERVLYLSRVGREKIIKYGTYNVEKARPVTQDHPYYAMREDPGPVPFKPTLSVPPAQAAQPAPEAAPAPEDPAALASQIMSSNFKVGLSQDEVDALLNGIF